jgi:hypothetical protein
MSKVEVDGSDAGVTIQATDVDLGNEKAPDIENEKTKLSIDVPTNSDGHETSTGPIITGADVSAHLIPLRDDFDAAITFRSFILASALVCFTASMDQIYNVMISVTLCFTKLTRLVQTQWRWPLDLILASSRLLCR